jgi:hypothetical protein
VTERWLCLTQATFRLSLKDRNPLMRPAKWAETPQGVRVCNVSPQITGSIEGQEDHEMSLTAKDSGSARVLVPAGSHVAVCVGVYDLGTQTETFDGKTKTAMKCWIDFQLTEEKSENNGPVTIGSFFSVSLHEKATLRKFLDSWRGRPFTQDELKGFHLGKLLGVPCMLNVIHENKAEGKVRDKIAAIMTLPKGMNKPSPSIKPVMIELEPGINKQAFESLPEFLKVIAAKSPEYAKVFVRSGGPDVGPMDSNGPDMEIPF